MAADQVEDPWRGSHKGKGQHGASTEREAVFRKERQASQAALVAKMAKLKALRLARDAENQDAVKRARIEVADDVAGGASKPKKSRRNSY